MTKLSVATPSNPTNLPSRYEIRKLIDEHTPFILAMVMHSNMFYSPVWPNMYPEDQHTKMLYEGYKAAHYLVQHQLESGHSFGVFDLEYQFKREESKPNGKLYWDLSDTSATKEQLLEQMDFPLVSVALSYDSINPLDLAKLQPMMDVYPQFGVLYHILADLDTRDPETWKATAERQVLFRNATATRRDAECKGIMKKMAQFLMRYADEQGFRAIQIECVSDAVNKVWSQPPAPYKGTIVCEFNTGTVEMEEEVDGVKKMVKPFEEKAFQRITKVYCDLRPGQTKHGNGHGTAPDTQIGAMG